MSITLGSLTVEMRHYLYIIQIMLLGFLYTYTLPKKEHFVRRLCISLPIFLAVAVVVPALLMPYWRYNLAIIFITFNLVLSYIYNSNRAEIGFLYIAAVTVQNLSYNTGILLCLLLGVSPEITSGFAPKLIQFLAFVGVNVPCFYLCAIPARNKNITAVGNSLTVVSAVSFLVIFVLEGYLSMSSQMYIAVTRIMFALCDILLLLLMFWMSEKVTAETEVQLMESLIAKEHAQFEINKETMEFINTKSHDMRHILGMMQKGEAVDGALLKEVQQATSSMNQVVRTGNPTLDVILTEKSWLSEKNQIRMTYMVDAESLKIFRADEIASIFGNLLDNAIQYLAGHVEPEYRVLSLTVKERVGRLFIHSENYCSDELNYDHGLPVTTKLDKRSHGFGLKSVRYIVSKYKGTMVVHSESHRFCIDISIPL